MKIRSRDGLVAKGLLVTEVPGGNGIRDKFNLRIDRSVETP